MGAVRFLVAADRLHLGRRMGRVVMSTGDTPAAGAGDEREQLPPMPPLSANSPEARAGRDSLHKDLAELELRDALGGIRAVITERLRTARAYATPGINVANVVMIPTILPRFTVRQ